MPLKQQMIFQRSRRPGDMKPNTKETHVQFKVLRQAHNFRSGPARLLGSGVEWPLLRQEGIQMYPAQG